MYHAVISCVISNNKQLLDEVEYAGYPELFILRLMLSPEG